MAILMMRSRAVGCLLSSRPATRGQGVGCQLSHATLERITNIAFAMSRQDTTVFEKSWIRRVSHEGAGSRAAAIG
jgi:hypothetical protein